MGEMRQGRESGCGQGSKGSRGTWAGDVAGFLHVCARGSAVVCEKMGLTGQAHYAEARARAREKRFGANGRAGAGACCAWWAKRQRERGGQDDLWFFFYSEFLIPFLFIFSFEFKSNQTTD
jgi:hypothetical protein